METLEQLKRSVQALAQPFDAQRRLFPAGIPAGEELALEFEEAMRACSQDDFPRETREAVQRLNLELERWSGHDPDFWFSDDALRGDSRWQVIRALARAVCDAFGWPRECSEFDDRIYVQAEHIPAERDSD